MLGQPPTADISVIGNRADGMMQGVFFRDVAGIRPADSTGW